MRPLCWEQEGAERPLRFRGPRESEKAPIPPPILTSRLSAATLSNPMLHAYPKPILTTFSESFSYSSRALNQLRDGWGG